VHLEQLTPENRALARQILRREFADFFSSMTSGSKSDNWPHIGDQELVDAIADSLIVLGKRSGRGVALLQTLVHELQDRVNQTLN